MIVVDANILVSALRSSRGAAHQLLRTMLQGFISYAVSPAVAVEYEDVLKRPGLLGREPWIKPHEIDLILDTIFLKATISDPSFRFRPFLNDPKDDLYIECAMASGATCIVSNDRHFRHPAVKAFGLSLINAAECMGLMQRGVIS